MDIQLIRTFLEVYRTRHFAHAARNLFVTQAAVSARIGQLEGLIGARVFSRQRNNIALTPAGERLLVHAEALISAWNRMLLQTAGIASGKGVLALGCLPSINEILIDNWLPHWCERLPDTLLRLETLKSEELIARVRARSLDVALLYEPLQAPGLSSIHVAQVPLVWVSTAEPVDHDKTRCVLLEWGGGFDGTQALPRDGELNVVAQVDSPKTARNLLLKLGGTALLPLSLVSEDIARGRLLRSSQHDPIARDVFFVQHERIAEELDSEALAEILRVVTG